MNFRNTPTTDLSPLQPRPLQNGARGGGSMRGECAAMSVAYVPDAAAEQGPVDDGIEIVVPGVDAIVEAVFPGAQGPQHAQVLRGPQISVIPANWPHATYRPQRSDVIIIALDPDFYKAIARDALGSPPPDIVDRYVGMDPLVREAATELRNELQKRGALRAIYLESWAVVIAIHMAQTRLVYGATAPAHKCCFGLSARRLNRVLAFIEEHLCDSILVARLAEAVNMSPYHFARMFKQTTGSSPHVYITMRRLSRAKYLLRHSDLPLIRVAELAGFQTQAHFTALFAKHIGMTPRLFRFGIPSLG
jgi:AraC family transcriptional regulator